MEDETNESIGVILNKIIDLYAPSYPHFKNCLIVFTDFDLNPIYFNHSDLSDELQVSHNISSILDTKNAFHLSKEKKGLVSYSHESSYEIGFNSIATPLILKDRILGFIGFFATNGFHEESVMYLDILEKYIISELINSTILRKMEEILFDPVNVFENDLSKRESEIFQMTVNGYKDVEMEKELFISKSTVRAHLHSVFEKLEVSSKNELISLYYKKIINIYIKLLKH
ncbi:helix-turn-helix transcriptional regulator [Sporosarcina sp. E16_8]|uniref:response regulator transcription factor n=1 Tax=Sporosarcina sp. E16_8 TaxID=2789295 RepID=UPI001A926AA0|nr:helix-turn-helix transcriptional regulator [Sporosarcina sp. E16_8]MBO0589446.1 hypothetical protein [Sporosarcina sp. E16_8]